MVSLQDAVNFKLYFKGTINFIGYRDTLLKYLRGQIFKAVALYIKILGKLLPDCSQILVQSFCLIRQLWKKNNKTLFFT